jgi:hypothetical protein
MQIVHYPGFEKKLTAFEYIETEIKTNITLSNVLKKHSLRSIFDLVMGYEKPSKNEIVVSKSKTAESTVRKQFIILIGALTFSLTATVLMFCAFCYYCSRKISRDHQKNKVS